MVRPAECVSGQGHAGPCPAAGSQPASYYLEAVKYSEQMWSKLGRASAPFCGALQVRCASSPRSAGPGGTLQPHDSAEAPGGVCNRISQSDEREQEAADGPVGHFRATNERNARRLNQQANRLFRRSSSSSHPLRGGVCLVAYLLMFSGVVWQACPSRRSPRSMRPRLAILNCTV